MNTQQGNVSLIIVAIVGIMLLGGAYVATQSSSRDTDTMMQGDTMMSDDTTTEGDTMMKKDDGSMTQDDAMMQKDSIDPAVSHMNDDSNAMMKHKESFVVHGTLLAGNQSPLIEFNETDFNAALKTDKTIMLFFYADWCPTCKAEFPLMQQAFNSHDGTDVIGFRVHYNDDQTTAAMQALAKEHGVAYQHTKVFIKNSTRVGKSPESWNTQQYLSAFAQYK